MPMRIAATAFAVTFGMSAGAFADGVPGKYIAPEPVYASSNNWAGVYFGGSALNSAPVTSNDGPGERSRSRLRIM